MEKQKKMSPKSKKALRIILGTLLVTLIAVILSTVMPTFNAEERAKLVVDHYFTALENGEGTEKLATVQLEGPCKIINYQLLRILEHHKGEKNDTSYHIIHMLYEVTLEDETQHPQKQEVEIIVSDEEGPKMKIVHFEVH